jgi:hypothetical protein
MTPNTLLGLVIALLITIGLPLVVLYAIPRYSRVPRQVVLYGGLCCLVSLAVSVPLTSFVWPGVFGSGSVGTLVATAVTVGVLQEVARFCGFRYVKTLRENADHAGAMAAGFGFGAVGSLLAGLQILGGLAIMIVIPSKFGISAVQQLLLHGGPQLVLQALRQIPLIACSMAFSVLAVLALRRWIGFLVVAIAAHVGVLLLSSLLPYLWGGAVLSLCGGLSLLLIALVVRSRMIAPDHPEEPDGRPSRPDPLAGAAPDL